MNRYCDDFKKAEKYLNSLIVMGSNRGYGQLHKPFSFCPYCKEKVVLQNE